VSDEAILIIGASETDSNLYYRTRFLAPDPFVCVEAGGKRTLLMSDLELDRAKSQARADAVLPYSAYREKAVQSGVPEPRTADVVAVFLRERGIESLLVPGSFAVEHADGLRERGFALRFKKEPFFEERAVKSPEEIDAIAEALRHVEQVMGEAIGLVRPPTSGTTSSSRRRAAHIGAGQAVRRRGALEARLCRQHTIVSSGDAACDPHNGGSGPLQARTGIILDIFPRVSTTRYFADITRTVCKGGAPEPLRRMYDAVRRAQDIAFGKIRAGVPDRRSTRQWRRSSSGRFETGLADIRDSSTGRATPWDRHPRAAGDGQDVRSRSGRQRRHRRAGLYYPGIGAVRIETWLWWKRTDAEISRFSRSSSCLTPPMTSDAGKGSRGS
jgi:Xaa-Pro aminopeptidase